MCRWSFCAVNVRNVDDEPRMFVLVGEAAGRMKLEDSDFLSILRRKTGLFLARETSFCSFRGIAYRLREWTFDLACSPSVS